MWLFTTFGYFSVVQKPGMRDLTVRARVRADLVRLRRGYLPELGRTVTGAGTDYPFRAVVSREAFARALAQVAREIRYANFKDEAVRRLGPARGAVYRDVWKSVAKLETLDASSEGPSSRDDPRAVKFTPAPRPKANSLRRPASA
jgi:hypothetical protein